MNRHSRDGRSGQALPLFVILIPGLLALMAMGIDGANVYLAKRDAQGAADLAAVSGAKLLPDEGAANALAEDIGIANGYLADEVTPFAHHGGDENKILVTVERDVPTYFMPILNFFGVGDYSHWTVDARAVAQLYPGSSGAGPGAIFAGGDSCTGGKYGVDVSGSNQEVYGSVHSNSDSNVGGGSNIFTETTDPDIEEPWTYVGTLKDGSIGNGNVYETGYPLDVGPSTVAWPDGWAPSVVDSAFLQPYRDLAVANGTFFTDKVDEITKDGVYYTTHEDGMDISSVSGSTRNVVLIATRGPIKLSESGVVFNALTHPSLPKNNSAQTQNNLLMLSDMNKSGDNKWCEEFTVAVSGSNSDWNGVIWGPEGHVEMSGSSNSALNGSLIGWSVKLNGSNIIIRNEGSGSTSDPSIALVE